MKAPGPRNLFEGSLEDFEILARVSIFRGAEASDLWEIKEKLEKLLIEAPVPLEPGPRQVYWFIKQICSPYEKFEDKVNPFGPELITENQRTIIPEDFFPADENALNTIPNYPIPILLKARIYDFLSTYGRATGQSKLNYFNGAISCYLEYVQFQQDFDMITPWDKYLYRAMSLSKRIKNNEKTLAGEDLLFQKMHESIAQSKIRGVHILLDLALKQNVKIPEDILADCMSLFPQNIERPDHFSYVDLGEILLKIAQRRKDTEQQKSFAMIICDIKKLMIDCDLKENPPNILSAHSKARSAIDILRKFSKGNPRIQEMENLFRKLSQGVVAQLGTISTSIDISDEVKSVREYFQGLEFLPAFIGFIFKFPLTERNEILESMMKFREASVLRLFATVTHLETDTGRTLAIEDPQKTSLEEQLIGHAAAIIWPIKVKSFLEPAWEILFYEHHPCFKDICNLLDGHPWISESQKGIVGRGIHHCIHGDFLAGLSILVFTVEPILRRILELENVRPMTFKPDKTEALYTLDTLLDHDIIKRTLGASLVFELKGHLSCEGFGLNFRHRIAHGLFSKDDFNPGNCIGPFWVILRLVFLPYFEVNYIKSGE